MPDETWKYSDAPVSPGWYARKWREGREITRSGGTVSINGRRMNQRQFDRYMLRALELRIAAKVGPAPNWRKLDPDYQVNQERDCGAIHARIRHRIRLHHLCTPELRRRFWHLTAKGEEGLPCPV